MDDKMIDRIIKRLDFPVEVMGSLGGFIFYIRDSYPLEYCILLRREEDIEYVIYECQREKLHELFRTENSLKAELYSVLFIEKKLKGLDYDRMKKIDEYIEHNNFNQVIEFYKGQDFSEYYSIGEEVYNKISLLVDNGTGTVYFHHKEFDFCINESIKIALAILANFSLDLKYVTELYDGFSDDEQRQIDFDDFAEKYVFIT